MNLANYNGMVLTKQGRDLQAKAEAGTKLVFTRVKIGDGQLLGQSYDDLNNLIHPQKDLMISSVKAEGDGLCRIRTHITNSGLQKGLFVYEIGLFAQDPDAGEILFSVTTASTPDYLPPEGGTTLVNHQFDIVTIVGNAANIEATINVDGYVSRADYNELLTRFEKVLVQLDINGRVPESNKGTFYDTFDGQPTRLSYLDSSAELTEDIIAGTLELPVVMTKGAFDVGEQVTIMDNENEETLKIMAVNDGTITVEQLVHAYKLGAVIARSTSKLDAVNQELNFPSWGTYSVNLVEVV